MQWERLSFVTSSRFPISRDSVDKLEQPERLNSVSPCNLPFRMAVSSNLCNKKDWAFCVHPAFQFRVAVSSNSSNQKKEDLWVDSGFLFLVAVSPNSCDKKDESVGSWFKYETSGGSVFKLVRRLRLSSASQSLSLHEFDDTATRDFILELRKIKLCEFIQVSNFGWHRRQTRATRTIKLCESLQSSNFGSQCRQSCAIRKIKLCEFIQLSNFRWRCHQTRATRRREGDLRVDLGF